jgi:serine/threonine protein kinase/Tol biopolymer transport system component
LIGSIVSHYQVLERIGGGDDGRATYKARDLELERMVTLEILARESSPEDSSAMRERLAHEITRASSLGDPHIGAVYEVGETADGRLFLAMAFSEGEPLQARLERGPLALEQAADIAAQVAGGLASAHAEGIVHGGLDASRIVLERDGQVMIVGFGLAMLPGEPGSSAAYRSPERLRGEPPGPHDDLWALGVLLYEMIAGSRPFAGVSEREIEKAVLRGRPEPLSAWREEVPRDLERLVARALAPRPEDRYPGAAELRADLTAVEETGALARGATRLELPSRAGTSASLLPPKGASATFRSPGSPARGIGAMGGKGGMIGLGIGHYTILEHLGGGGMGVVYKAEDARLERTVALKFLPPELTRDPVAKARFLQEARAASALDHPNVCTIHEVDETEDGQLYLAMPCYDGETLKRRLERGPLPLDEAIDIAIQIGQGLAKAHRQGIVHRDIKPANLIVTDDGIAKILDFGLAKLAGAAGLTRAGYALGTPSYMSPEQARGEVDHRTDIWALGVVLYEMIAGRPPFRAETDQGIIYSLLTEEPEALSKARPGVPAEIERIVGRMLAKDPNDRYPTMGEALADLRALGGFSSTLTRVSLGRALPQASRPWWIAPLVSAVALLVLVGIVLALRNAGWLGGAPGKALTSNFEHVTTQEGSESFPSLSPDGQQVVYAHSEEGNSDIYLQRVAGETVTDLTAGSSADDTQPAYSPDGQQIAFRSERDGGGIFIMGATGESPRRLSRIGYNPVWSPDGGSVLVATESVSEPSQRSSHSQLWRIRVTGEDPKLLYRGDAVQPSWSPHGQRIAFWGLDRESRRIIWTIPAEGGAAVQVTEGKWTDWNPVWSPDGRYLYFISDRGGSVGPWRVPIDESSGKVRGEPEQITIPQEWCGLLSFSQDGRRMVFQGSQHDAVLEALEIDPDHPGLARPMVLKIPGRKSPSYADVSPDGQRIAFNTLRPQEDLFVVRRDGTGLLRLTNDPAKDRAPQWSPDGSLLLFYSNRDDRYQAWTIRPDGSERQKVTDTEAPFLGPIWSPDGRRFVGGLDFGASAIATLGNAPVKQPERLPPAGPNGESFSANSWSADGAWLVGSVQRPDALIVPGIFLYSLAGHFYRKVSDHGEGPVWLPDGRRIAFLDGGKAFLLDLATGRSSELAVPPQSYRYTEIKAGRDDRTLYLLRSRDEDDIGMVTLGEDTAP